MAYLLAGWADMGPRGVFIAILLAEVLVAGIGVWVFRKGHWREVRV